MGHIVTAHRNTSQGLFSLDWQKGENPRARKKQKRRKQQVLIEAAAAAAAAEKPRKQQKKQEQKIQQKGQSRRRAENSTAVIEAGTCAKSEMQFRTCNPNPRLKRAAKQSEYQKAQQIPGLLLRAGRKTTETKNSV